MSSIEETMACVVKMKDALENVKTSVSTIEEIDSLSDIHDIIGPKSSAELNVGLAFAVSSLYFMMLKTKGISTANHPIKEDLTRIKQYVSKIKQLDESSGGESTAKKRKVTVDSEAAKRVVEHELASNSTQFGTSGSEDNSTTKVNKVQNTPTTPGCERKSLSGGTKKSATPTSQKKKKKSKQKKK